MKDGDTLGIHAEHCLRLDDNQFGLVGVGGVWSEDNVSGYVVEA